MARPNPIRRIMEHPLPSITYQRRKLFRPSDADVTYAYTILNRYVFDNELRRPEIRQRQVKKVWGQCHWETETQESGSNCIIDLSNKWFCVQWLMNTLAHEMVHQYQWDIYRWDHQDYYGHDIYTDSGAHGPSFYMWRDRFAHYGLNLKRYHRQAKWFRYQDFARC